MIYLVLFLAFMSFWCPMCAITGARRPWGILTAIPRAIVISATCCLIVWATNLIVFYFATYILHQEWKIEVITI